MTTKLMQWWAVVFIVLCVCPFTAPFSTFDVAGPHGPASDTHTGVAAAKFATDEPVVALVVADALVPVPYECATRPVPLFDRPFQAQVRVTILRI